MAGPRQLAAYCTVKRPFLSWRLFVKRGEVVCARPSPRFDEAKKSRDPQTVLAVSQTEQTSSEPIADDCGNGICTFSNEKKKRSGWLAGLRYIARLQKCVWNEGKI